MVAAAFKSLKNDNPKDEGTNLASSKIDERIINAKTVNGLLGITENNNGFSRKHALKIVSILAEWSTMDRVKISEFENGSLRPRRLATWAGRPISS